MQAKFAAQLPYRQAADLLRELLPASGGLNHATTRNRTLAVGRSLDRELCREIEHPQVPAEPAPKVRKNLIKGKVTSLKENRADNVRREVAWNQERNVGFGWGNVVHAVT